MFVCEEGKEKEKKLEWEKKNIDFLVIVQWPGLNGLLKEEKSISFGKERGCFLYKLSCFHQGN